MSKNSKAIADMCIHHNEIFGKNAVQTHMPT